MKILRLSERSYRINKVLVVGAGTWGCSISSVLQKNGSAVTLYHYNPDFVDYLCKERIHPHLLNMPLDSNIFITSNKADFKDMEYIFLAIPTQSIRTFLEKIESVDMNRLIDNDIDIKLIFTKVDAIPVDTLNDLKKVEKIMKKNKLFNKYKHI